MYEYTIATDFKLNTSFCKNLNEVEQIPISQTSNCIHTISKYPNGFILESIVFFDRTILKTNKPLIQNSDGTFSVVL